MTSPLLVTSTPVDQLGVLVKVEVAVLKVHVSLNVRSESRIKSPGVPGLTTSLMFLSWVELAAHEVPVTLCPFLMVLSVIVLAARVVHVPPRVG